MTPHFRFLTVFSKRCAQFCAAMALWLSLSSSALASQISQVELQEQGDKVLLVLTYSEDVVAPKVFAIDGSAPRIVVDVASSDAKPLPTSPMAGQYGVKQIRYAPRDSGTRLVLDVAVGAKLAAQSHEGARTVITLAGLSSQAVVPAVPIAVPRASPKSPKGLPIPRVKPIISAIVQRKSIIVIDPGHGGYDPGAIGGGGTKEKTLTLAAAKELQEQLLKTGRYDVILTRSKDVYVVHDERVRKARIKDADLFISIHADSLDSNKTRGASVYTLADYARKRSTKLVNSQNWIMDVDLTETSGDIGDILVDLAQRKTFSNSDKFAGMLVPQLSKVTPILGNTHRRAGLAVLLAPDVPAVLLEMGFISNVQDEKALNSAAHRRKLMGAVTRTIDSYFSD